MPDPSKPSNYWRSDMGALSDNAVGLWASNAGRRDYLAPNWQRLAERRGQMGAQMPTPISTPTRTPPTVTPTPTRPSVPTQTPVSAAPTPKPTGERLPKTSTGKYNPDYPELASATMNQWLKEGGEVPGLTNPWLSTIQQGDATQQDNTPSGGSWGSAGGYSNRSRNAWLDGLRPGLSQWADAFEDEHRGRSVFEVYGGAPPEDLSNSQINYVLSDALLDKAWGDKFYDTYHRAPSEDDWKASFYDRERLKARNESPWGGRWQG